METIATNWLGGKTRRCQEREGKEGKIVGTQQTSENPNTSEIHASLCLLSDTSSTGKYSGEFIGGTTGLLYRREDKYIVANVKTS